MDDTSPADRFPLIETATPEFGTTQPLEIGSLLSQMQVRGARITLMAPEGVSYNTKIWSLDAPRQLTFNADSGSSPLLESLVASNEVTAVSYLDKVKVQFDLQGLNRVRGPHHLLVASWPQQLYRFQRRDSFRVQPLPSHMPVVRWRHPTLNDPGQPWQVLDISLGGLSLALPAHMPPLDAGALLTACQLELDAFTRLDVDLVVRHVAVMNPDLQGARLGCEYAQLSGADARTLQGWIQQSQKRLVAIQLGG